VANDGQHEATEAELTSDKISDTKWFYEHRGVAVAAFAATVNVTKRRWFAAAVVFMASSLKLGYAKRPHELIKACVKL